MSEKNNKRILKKYAVFSMSLANTYVKKKRQQDVNFPNLRILVRSNVQYQKAQNKHGALQLKELKLKRPKHYKRILKSEPPSFFDDLGEAYKAAYKKLGSLLKGGRKAKVLGDSVNSNCSVYCIKLKSTVWMDKQFSKVNSGIVNNKTKKLAIPIDAYYVGQTSKAIEERYNEHMDSQQQNSTKWGNKYFLESFDEAYDSELIQMFMKESGFSTFGLLHGKSIIVEHELTNWIRKKNLGAYCA